MAVKGLKLNITSKSFGGGSSIPKMDFGGSKLGIQPAKIKSSSLLDTTDTLVSKGNVASHENMKQETNKIHATISHLTTFVRKNRGKINDNTAKIDQNEQNIKINAKKITLLKNVIKAQEPFGGNEDPLAEVNNTLEEIGVLLALDFSRREEIAKEELANQREEKAERKRSMKERMIEGLKGVGRKGMGAAKGAAGSVGGAAAKPVAGIFDQIKEVVALLGTAVFANNAIDWLKDEKNQEKVGNFFKFIAKHWKWVLGAVAGVAALTALGGLVSVIGGLGAALGIFANPLAWKIMAAIAIGYGVWKGGRWIHKKFVGGEEFVEAHAENNKKKEALHELGITNTGMITGPGGKRLVSVEEHGTEAQKEAWRDFKNEQIRIDNIRDEMRDEMDAEKKKAREAWKEEAMASKVGKAKVDWKYWNKKWDEDWAKQQDAIRAKHEQRIVSEATTKAERIKINTKSGIDEQAARLNQAPEEDAFIDIDLGRIRKDGTPITSDQQSDVNEVEFIASINKLNPYMEETPELLGIV